MPLNISAGEFFDLIRPAIFILSLLLSSLVLASALRWRFAYPLVALWVIGTLLYPLITLPLYLLALVIRKRQKNLHQKQTPLPLALRLLPAVYLVLSLTVFGVFFYREQRSVDAHLARATHARLHNDRGRIIKEYRAALELKDDPYIRKLLAIELAESGFLSEALREFRRSEHNGELDDLTAFRIASLLETLDHPGEAAIEYRRFLASPICGEELPDPRCDIARARLNDASQRR
jgi:hypothetical protein